MAEEPIKFKVDQSKVVAKLTGEVAELVSQKAQLTVLVEQLIEENARLRQEKEPPSP